MKKLTYLIFTAFLILMTSCLKQEKNNIIPGVNGPKINVQDGKILLSLELTKINSQVGITLPIPKMDSSTVTYGPYMNDEGQMSGTLLKVSLDLKDVESDEFKVVPPQKLPDGRDFPITVNGDLPALAFNMPKLKNSTFYVSEHLFGFFLPLKLPTNENLKFGVAFKIKVNGKNFGIVSLISPNEYDEGSGALVILSLKDIKQNSKFKKLLKYSKKKKNRLF